LQTKSDQGEAQRRNEASGSACIELVASLAVDVHPSRKTASCDWRELELGLQSANEWIPVADRRVVLEVDRSICAIKCKEFGMQSSPGAPFLRTSRTRARGDRALNHPGSTR
jgi:hypothetical protein